MPLVGASGAVAGLMGLCGVLYGRRPIRFFYFIGVYADYVKAPALVLLGLWLGKEVFQFLRYSELSNVAYTAHIGGLLTGAAAGAAVRFGTGAVDEAALDEPRATEAFERRLAEANRAPWPRWSRAGAAAVRAPGARAPGPPRRARRPLPRMPLRARERGIPRCRPAHPGARARRRGDRGAAGHGVPRLPPGVPGRGRVSMARRCSA
ncbi:MAG: rhomboid family intramembrane serine protease [Halofilum sp. (in: g-proteobacteria)]|nr:rhomboid family intramembrane serine protease [Halofilum sp. (in: g-proteobacteria)]